MLNRRPYVTLCLVGIMTILTFSAHAQTPTHANWINDLSPIEVSDWSYEFAAHLYERAGFGAAPEEIQRLAEMTPGEAVSFFVDYENISNDHLDPFEHSGVWEPGMDPLPKSRPAATDQARDTGSSMGIPVDPDSNRPIQPIVNQFFYALRANEFECRRASQWWAERMLTTRRPLEEKMALFWHNHFATTDTKVRDYRKLLIQLELFHGHATGNFKELLLGVTKDPGMLAFLDNAENVKEHPNENFGRELMELFSMGVGNYTEKDIREASRAFTGWTDDKLQFVVHADQHDTGQKTVLGQTGNFDGEDIINVICEQPATANFIAAKIYRYFVRKDISPDLQKELGRVLRSNNYETKPLLQKIFLSKDFYSSASIATQIKSPVLLSISTFRKLGLDRIPGIPDYNSSTRKLGQELFHPPNVAGWAGGRAWITPATLLDRGNFAHNLLFPNVDNFYAPDRNMPGIYRSVGRKIDQGMGITEATMQGDSSFSKLATADEQFNTRYGVYQGYLKAFKVVIPIPRFPADVNLTQMLQHAGVSTSDEAVNYLLKRFMSVSLEESDREMLTGFIQNRLQDRSFDLTGEKIEQDLRALLHLIMSAPEYQLM